jgi:hypothetical protein
MRSFVTGLPKYMCECNINNPMSRNFNPLVLFERNEQVQISSPDYKSKFHSKYSLILEEIICIMNTDSKPINPLLSYIFPPEFLFVFN